MNHKKYFILFYLFSILALSANEDLNRCLNAVHSKMVVRNLELRQQEIPSSEEITQRVLAPGVVLERPFHSYLEDENFIKLGAMIAGEYKQINSLIYNDQTPLDKQLIYSMAARTMNKSQFIDFLSYTTENNISPSSNKRLLTSLYSMPKPYDNLWADKNDKRLISIATEALDTLTQKHDMASLFNSVLDGKVEYSNEHGEVTDSLGVPNSAKNILAKEQHKYDLASLKQRTKPTIAIVALLLVAASIYYYLRHKKPEP